MDTRQFIAEHLHDDVHDLALKKTPAGVDKTLALCQIEARQLLQKKVPSWSVNDDLLFPPHLSIEQCSSEATALYKASLLQGQSFADLTGGLGVDCFFISQHFQTSFYVERNPELCALAKHNFKVLADSGALLSKGSSEGFMENRLTDAPARPTDGLPRFTDVPARPTDAPARSTDGLSRFTDVPTRPTEVINESAEAYLLHCEPVDCLFLDPARRDSHGHKTVSISDCTPNVLELQELLLRKARRVMLKLSPMLDTSQALKELHQVSEVHVVAVGNECKELLFIMESGFEGTPRFTCVNLQSGQSMVTFTLEEERDSVSHLATEVGGYLYEPNAALMKGGCYKLLTQRFGVLKLHPHSHLYTSDQLVPSFPGRIFKVEGWAPFNKKVKQELLADVAKASIAVRNFPLTVAELRKAWKIGDGDEVYLFATTLTGDQKIVIKTTRQGLFTLPSSTASRSGR